MVVAVLEASRATWTEHHVRAEAHRQLRRYPTADRDALVEAAVGVACDPARVLRIETPRTMPEPAELCRRSGESVFVEHASARYTTLRLLDAEERIVTAARHTTYHPELDPDLINQAIAGSTRRLSGEQVGMVRAFTRSDRFLLLGLAPAGAGKTTTMRAVVQAWRAGWSAGGGVGAVRGRRRCAPDRARHRRGHPGEVRPRPTRDHPRDVDPGR